MPHEKERSLRVYSEWLILGCVLLAVGVALGWARYQEHEAVRSREENHLTDQIRMLDANLYQQLDALSRALVSIRGSIPYWQAEGNLPQLASRRLEAFAQTMVGVRSFAVIDKQGEVIASSNPRFIGLNVSARPYFVAASTRPREDLLYVNAPVKTAQGQWLITFSREIVDAQGRFDGLVIASLDRAQFEILLSSARYAADMEVMLAHGDGIHFMTVPSNVRAAPGAKVAAGVISQARHQSGLLLAEEARADQVYLVAARRLQPPALGMDKPLLLALGRSRSAVYADWFATTVAWVGSYLAFGVFAMLGLLAVQGRRRELMLVMLRNERALHEKNRALEAANRLLMTQQAQLQSMVFLDGLTGIANRRHFDEALLREWAHCQRIQSPVSLLMLDLDHFKLLNDHYGHQAGDLCLQQVAQVLQLGLFRPHDLAARYGGEEFVCLLPECGLEDARVKAERIRVEIEALAIPNATASGRAMLTASIGVACCIPQGDGKAEVLIAQADAALYRAKAGGRNCVVATTPSTAQFNT